MGHWTIGGRERIMMFDSQKPRAMGTSSVYPREGDNGTAAPASPPPTRKIEEMVHAAAQAAAAEAVRQVKMEEQQRQQQQQQQLQQQQQQYGKTGGDDGHSAWSSPGWSSAAWSTTSYGKASWSDASGKWGGGDGSGSSGSAGPGPWRNPPTRFASPYPKSGKGTKDKSDDARRGGWFSKCQRISKAVLDCNWGYARDLAEEYYAGKDEF